MTKFLNAVNRIPQSTPPIWMMRQAGRYHSHYQALRKKHSFIELCKIPELAAEVTMGPIDEFDFDAAIIFSDILFPLMELGVKIEYTNNGVFTDNLITSQNINLLRTDIDIASGLNFQKQAIQQVKERLPKNKSLLGFIGGIYTLFQYASGKVDYKDNADFLNSFSKKILPLLKTNIQLQLDGGADIVMIFDSSTGLVNADFYKKNIMPYLIDLAETFPNKLGYYSKGTNIEYLNKIVEANFAGLGFDENVDIGSMLTSTNKGFIQGNFNNNYMLLPKDDLKPKLKLYLERMGELSLEERSGWVCGLSHGVIKETPEENVHYFIDEVRRFFQ